MKDRRERRIAPMINERIRAPHMQVIASDGENVGVLARTDALRMAENENLDLVLLSEGGSDGVPVVKVMDFGKALYEKKKKLTKAKKHQKVIQVKEIKMRPKISGHDFLTKIKHAVEFLRDGKRVKITLSFRGRENILKMERGAEIFGKIDKTLEDMGLAGSVACEGESSMGQLWSRIYYLK